MYVVCGRTASAGGTAFSRFLAIVASRADWNGVAPDPQTRGDHGRLVLGGAHHITNPRCSGPSCQVIVRVFVGCTTAQHTMLWWGRCLWGARRPNTQCCGGDGVCWVRARAHQARGLGQRRLRRFLREALAAARAPRVLRAPRSGAGQLRPGLRPAAQRPNTCHSPTAAVGVLHRGCSCKAGAAHLHQPAKVWKLGPWNSAAGAGCPGRPPPSSRRQLRWNARCRHITTPR